MTRHPRIINSTSGSAMLPNQKRRMKQVIATIRRTTLLLALIFLLIAPLTAIAAQPTPTQTPSVKDVQAKTGGKKDPNGKEKEQPKPPPPVPTKVTCVYNRDFGPDCEKREDQDRNSAGINDTIIVEVKELRQLVTRADCKDPNRPSTCAKQDIILFIDRRPVKGLTPESKWLHPDPDPNPDGILRYHLKRSDQSDEQWADLLGFTLNGVTWSLSKKVEVSVGLENEYAVDSEVKGFELIRLRGWRLFGWSILIAGILFLLIRRAIKTDLLRDPHPVEWGKRRPYSLSQCQAAWWFALILTSFTFIYLVTGQFDISASALILLGIGFGTAVGASMIDEGRQETDVNNQPNNGKLQDMLEEKARIEMELNNLSITRRALLSDEEKKNLDEQLKAKEAEAKAKVQEISNEFPNAIRPGSEGLRKDILTDANGARFHRYQMAAWTFILGIIFLQQVLSRLAMPKFSETVLALMGISAGTFLGLKTTEQHNTQAPPGGDNGGSPPAQPARVERLTPNAGVQAGGDTVEIAGSGFVSGASVTFGGVAATVSAVEATKITVTTPAHAAGAVDVIVTNPDKAGAKLANGFTY